MRYTYPKYYSWFIYFLIVALLVFSALMLSRAGQLYQMLITVIGASLAIALLLLYERKIRLFALTLSDKSIRFDSWRGSSNISYDQITMSLVRPFRMQVVRLKFGDKKIDLDRNMINYPALLENLKIKIPSSRVSSEHRLPLILRLSAFDAYLTGVLVTTPVLLLLYFTENAAPYFKATSYYPLTILAFIGLTGFFLYVLLRTPLRFHFYENHIQIDCVAFKYNFESAAMSEVRMDDLGTKGRQIVLKFGRKKFTIMEQRTNHLIEELYDLICKHYGNR